MPEAVPAEALEMGIEIEEALRDGILDGVEDLRRQGHTAEVIAAHRRQWRASAIQVIILQSRLATRKFQDSQGYP